MKSKRIKLFVETEKGNKVVVDQFNVGDEKLPGRKGNLIKNISNAVEAAVALDGAQDDWPKVDEFEIPLRVMSDYDILTKWLKYDDKDAKEIMSRKRIQKLEELKLQVMAQNPTLCFGLTGEDNGINPKAD